MKLQEIIEKHNNRKFRRTSWDNNNYKIYNFGYHFINEGDNYHIFTEQDILADDWEFVIQYSTLGKLLEEHEGPCKLRRKQWQRCYITKNQNGTINAEFCCLDDCDLAAYDWYKVEE